MNSIYSIFIGTCFFVMGQVFLKKTFNNDKDFIMTNIYFSLGITLAALITFIILNINYKLSYNKPKLSNAIIAGILFFLGNMCWIYSISTGDPLGNIRVIMAGFETILLFIVGYLIFYNKINMYQGLGFIIILTGIYIINSN